MAFALCWKDCSSGPNSPPQPGSTISQPPDKENSQMSILRFVGTNFSGSRWRKFHQVTFAILCSSSREVTSLIVNILVRYVEPQSFFLQILYAYHWIPCCLSGVREHQGSTWVSLSVIQSVSQLVSKNLHIDIIITIP